MNCVSSETQLCCSNLLECHPFPNFSKKVILPLRKMQTSIPSFPPAQLHSHRVTGKSSNAIQAEQPQRDVATNGHRLAIQVCPHSLRLTLGAQFSLAAVAIFCLVWTVWLMLLTAAPNVTVNRVMKTEILDEGSFWRFIDPPQATLAVGLGGLGIAALGYLFIIARVTVFRNREFAGWKKRLPHKIHSRQHFSTLRRRIAAVAAASEVDRPENFNGAMTRQAATMALDLLATDSSYRKNLVRQLRTLTVMR